VRCYLLLVGHPTGITFSGTTVGSNAVRVAAMQAPGVSGANVWLLPDPAAAAAMPGGYVWPAALTALAHSAGSNAGGVSSNAASRHNNQAAVRAAIGASVAAVVGVALLSAAAWLWYNRRRRRQQHRQPLKVHAVAAITPAAASGCEQCMHSRESSAHGRRKQLSSGRHARLSAGSDASVEVDQGVDTEPKEHCGICAEQLPADTRTPKNSEERERAVSCRTIDESYAGPSSRVRNSGEQPGSYHVSNNSYGSASLGDTVESESLDATGDSVSTGLERWKAAISMTTMQMMERRMAQSLHPTPPSSGSGGSQQSSAAAAAAQQRSVRSPAGAAAAAAAAGGMLAQGPGVPPAAQNSAAGGGGVRRSNSRGAEGLAQAQQPLRLQMLIGQGSFGSVYLGTW
jgi:hypothetical protein